MIEVKCVEWSWFKKAVKIEQTNNDLFSDTVLSKKKSNKAVNEVTYELTCVPHTSPLGMIDTATAIIRMSW